MVARVGLLFDQGVHKIPAGAPYIDTMSQTETKLVLESETSNSALEALYRTERDRLWRALWAYARSSEIASDALAEAFAQALWRGAQIREPRAWIWRASFRIAAGELKRRHDVPTEALRQQPDQIMDPHYDVLGALAKLSPMQRGSIVLRYYEGQSAREIAAALGSTAQAVRIHLSRGRRRLKRILEGDDEA